MGKGASAGTVRMAPYLEDVQALWLAGTTVDTGSWGASPPSAPVVTIWDILDENLGVGGNPYVTYGSLYDPSALYADSQIRMNTFWTKITGLGGLNDQTDWEARITSALNKANTAGVLNPVDVATMHDAARAEASDEITEALTKKASGVNEVTSLESYYDAVKAKIDSVGFLPEIPIGSIHDLARNEANDEINSAILKKASGLDEVVRWGEFYDVVKAKLAADGLFENVNIDDLIAKAKTEASAEITLAKGQSSGIDESTYWKSLVDVVLERVNTCEFVNPVDVDNLVFKAVAMAKKQVETIVRTVQDLIDSGALDDLVAAYDTGAQNQRAKAVRSFTSPMAEAGAVHGSAYLIGLSLIYTQHQQDVNKFRADRTHELFKELLMAQVNSNLGNINAAAQVKVANKQSRDASMMAAIDSMLRMFTERVRFDQSLSQLHSLTHQSILNHGIQSEGVRGTRDTMFAQSMDSITKLLSARFTYEQAMMTLHTQLFAQSVDSQLRADMVEKSSRDNLLSQGTGLAANILSGRLGYEQGLIGLHGQLFSRSLDGKLKAGIFEKEKRDNFVYGGAQTMLASLTDNTRTHMGAVQAQTEINRIRAVGEAESDMANLEFGVRAASWDFKVYEMASGILAAATGQSAVIPEKPGIGASAIGGAMQGGALGGATVAALAAAGVATGGLALPIIAGGVALGGLAGLLQ